MIIETVLGASMSVLEGFYL